MRPTTNINGDVVISNRGDGLGTLYWKFKPNGDLVIPGSIYAYQHWSSDWYYVTGDGGLYNNTYGRGIRDPQSAGSAYGNICTYNTGRNGWTGYSIADPSGFFYSLMSNGNAPGFYSQSQGYWVWYYGANYSLGIGSSTTSGSYTLYVSGAIYATNDITAYSDRRKKTDIVTIDDALDKVTRLRGVYYTKIGEEDKGRKTGVIAQEINEVLPEVVTYAADVDEYGVAYGNTVGLLIEAIKEQQKQIEELKAIINALTN
jgi:hypothetical protein